MTVDHTLLIRADASTVIGTGHVMRCLALAQAWQLDGGKVVFLSHCESNALRQLIVEAGIEFISLTNPHPDSQDLQATLDSLRRCTDEAKENSTWLVLDGYHFDPGYQQEVRTAGYRLLVIDDLAHFPVYHADILLNQNLGFDKYKYKCDSDTTLLLGSQYMLLRQEFRAWIGWQRQIPKVANKVLITMGGSDLDNVTLKTIYALENVDVIGLEAVVVVGSSNPHYRILQSAIHNMQLNIHLVSNISNMPELMAWADVAISAGGSTFWELAFMQLPSLVIAIADNQSDLVKQLEDSKMAVNLGWHQDIRPSLITQSLTRLLMSYEERTALMQREEAQIDGDGVDRVLMRIQGHKIRLRQVREEDKYQLWKWANEPEVRTASFTTDTISWNQHVGWFATKKKDPNCVFYLALDDADIPLGQVRFDIDNKEATISLSLDVKYRGQGYGSQLITQASKKLCQEWPVHFIHAFIKSSNETSKHAFLKANFLEDKDVVVHGQPARHMVLRNDRIL